MSAPKPYSVAEVEREFAAPAIIDGSTYHLRRVALSEVRPRVLATALAAEDRDALRVIRSQLIDELEAVKKQRVELAEALRACLGALRGDEQQEQSEGREGLASRACNVARAALRKAGY